MLKKRFSLGLFAIFILCTPLIVFASSGSKEQSSIDTLFSKLAIVNDGFNSGNLNIIIIGMVVVIIILIGAAMFATKK